jgi:phospholipid transport system substrate-binding protein
MSPDPRLNNAQQKKVIERFREFSVSTYAAAFSDYDGEKFEISNDRIQPGIGTIVETSLVFENEPSVKLSYLLRQTSVGWRIVDVYLAGTVSELARRREEFGSLIQSRGIDGLIALLKRKSDELAIN